MPMVFQGRSYVREALVSLYREGWGWGRIATPAQNMPGGLVVGYPGALGSVWLFNGRTGELPKKAALYFRCESRCVLLRTKGAFGVSVDRNYSSRAWHLELEIWIVRHRIELCECGSSEQGVIATAKRDYVED